MKKLILAEMNPKQAREHYDALVWKRKYRAQLQLSHAYKADKAIRAKMVSEARWAMDKAEAWSIPQAWHAARAEKLLQSYGMGVAAAFLAAHGWNFKESHRVLFGYFP